MYYTYDAAIHEHTTCMYNTDVDQTIDVKVGGNHHNTPEKQNTHKCNCQFAMAAIIKWRATSLGPDFGIHLQSC